MTFPNGVPVVLVKRTKGSPDGHGNDTWTTTETTVQGIYSPGSSSELIQGQDQLTTQPTVYLPTGTNVSAVDAVRVAGETFEVDGAPNKWASPFSNWSPGIEVHLKRVTG